MEEKPEPQVPKVTLATQDWVLKELMDTERRIEKAFHQQTTYLDSKFNAQNRWILGVIISIVAAILAMVAAVFIQ